MIFEPFSIRDVTFKNRVLRSSLGGRMAHYDGTVSSVWKNFEKRFAEGGVGGIISTTFNVNRVRKSPLEYPPLSEDRYVAPLARYIAEIRATGCRYIVQIGDPGYATQTSTSGRKCVAGSTSAPAHGAASEGPKLLQPLSQSSGRHPLCFLRGTKSP